MTKNNVRAGGTCEIREKALIQKIHMKIELTFVEYSALEKDKRII